MAIQALSPAASAANAATEYEQVNTVIHEVHHPDGSVSTSTSKTITYSDQNTGDTTETVVSYSSTGSAKPNAAASPSDDTPDDGVDSGTTTLQNLNLTDAQKKRIDAILESAKTGNIDAAATTNAIASVLTPAQNTQLNGTLSTFNASA